MGDAGFSTDKITGRPLIDGRMAPIDGGVFRRRGQSGITVDRKDFEKHDWFNEVSVMVRDGNPNMWSIFATSAARSYMPVGEGRQEQLERAELATDSYNLASMTKNKDGIAKGVYDAQALFVAMLVEGRVRKLKGGRQVWIAKDANDGHAIVNYQNSEGTLYRFDPSTDRHFVEPSKKMDNLSSELDPIGPLTFSAAHDIGPATRNAISGMNSLEQVKQDAIISFSKGNTGLVYITRVNNIRKRVIMDCTRSPLTRDDIQPLDAAKQRMDPVKRTSSIFYSPTKGGYLFEDDGSLNKIEILLKYNDEGTLFRLSFDDQTLGYEGLGKKAEAGLNKHELKALGIAAKYNAKAGGYEFNVSYSSGDVDQSVDSPFVPEIKKAVEYFFTRTE